MSSYLVILAYGSSLALALGLVYLFHSRWYWHILAMALAVGVGLVHFPPQWAGPTLDLAVGSLFVFLCAWGLGEPLLHSAHVKHHHA